MINPSRRPSLQDLNQRGEKTLAAHLGIEFTAMGEDWLEATMPVDERTRQPAGLLHGGASVALAETLGSVASVLQIDLSKQSIVGLEINANHIRSVRQGTVTWRVSPIHLGRSTHLWDIKITDEQGRLICVSRLTVAVLNRPS